MVQRCYIDEMVVKQVFILILLAQGFASRAQLSVGVGIGYSHNHLREDVSDRSYTRNKNGGGYAAYFKVDYQVTDWLGLRAGCGIIQKNHSFFRTQRYTGIYQRFANSYLQWPLMGKIKVFQKSKFNVHATVGIYCAYWLSARVSGVTPNIFNTTAVIDEGGQIVDYFFLTSYSARYEFNNVRDNRFEFGFAFGTEISYEFYDKYSFFLESNYYPSLTDQQQKYAINQSPRMNRTFSISAGCSMRIPSER